MEFVAHDWRAALAADAQLALRRHGMADIKDRLARSQSVLRAGRDESRQKDSAPATRRAIDDQNLALPYGSEPEQGERTDVDQSA